MGQIIDTPRLQLVPLDLGQLECMLYQAADLESSLDIRIMRDFITDRVQRAMRMKLEKMHKADLLQHDWLTYWLIVITEEKMGAGMLGFKGFPNSEGATEIGYGIDPAYQGRGYMSEAVQALVDWAFTHPFCHVITASEVENPASRRLLEKLGARLVHASDRSTSWEIHRADRV